MVEEDHVSRASTVYSAHKSWQFSFLGKFERSLEHWTCSKSNENKTQVLFRMVAGAEELVPEVLAEGEERPSGQCFVIGVFKIKITGIFL